MLLVIFTECHPHSVKVPNCIQPNLFHSYISCQVLREEYKFLTLPNFIFVLKLLLLLKSYDFLNWINKYLLINSTKVHKGMACSVLSVGLELRNTAWAACSSHCFTVKIFSLHFNWFGLLLHYMFATATQLFFH